MTKLKKFLTIFLIFFVTFLVLFTNKASAGNIGNSFRLIGGYIDENNNKKRDEGENRYWRNELFCIEHGADFSDSKTYELSLSETATYSSDSTDEFERGIAYIIYEAATHTDPNHNNQKMNCYGWNEKAEKYNGNKYQQALWKFLNEPKGILKDPFKDCQTAEVTDNVLYPKKNGTYDPNDPYYKAKNVKQKAFSNNSKVSISNFTMDESKGNFTISQLTNEAKVSQIKINWEDNSSEVYSGNNTNFALYTDSKYNKKLNNKSEIKQGNIIYIENNKSYRIKSIDINARAQTYDGKGYGYSVTIYRYGNGDAQDLIYTEVTPGTPKSLSCNAEPTYKGYQLEIKKRDYDNPNILLNNCRFAIYLDAQDNNKDGWIGYNTSANVVELGKKYSESYKFRTGSNYCKLGNKNGSIRINNLAIGTYYIFETQTKDNRYSLDSQIGYNKIGDNLKFPKGMEISGKYAYCGKTKIEEKDKGTNNYKAIKLFNRKTTELKIVKRDEKNTKKTIAGVGIKILIDKSEQADYMGEFKETHFVWLKRDGSFSTDCNDPECEFITDSKGEINIKGVPYGKYYIYEVKSAENYALSRQEGYMKGEKPINYKGALPTEWVYLGSTTIEQEKEHGIIKDGKDIIYTIASSMNEIFVADIVGGSKASGANARLYYNNGTDAQKYQFIYVGDGYYMIKNVNSGKYLDLSGRVCANGQNIRQYDANYTDAQLWTIVEEKDPTGYTMYVIKSKCKDTNNKEYCIGVNGDLATNGANIELQEYRANMKQKNNTNIYSQRFVLYEKDIIQYSIATSKDSSYYASIENEGIKSKIKTKKLEKPGEKETFQIARAMYKEWTAPCYIIYNRKTNFVLDVCSEIINNKTVWTIKTYTNDRSGSQKWDLQEEDKSKDSKDYIKNISSIESLNTGHTLKFISRKSNTGIDKLALNLSGGQVGNYLQGYRDDNTMACKFVVKKINNGSLVKPLETENSQRITFEAVNKEGGDGKITIIKQDKDNSKKLQGAEFKIYKENGGWVTQDGEEISYNTDYSKATAFVTDENGQKVINNLYLGDYYIYETKAPANYSLSQQEGYLRGEKGSESITDKEWVYAGNCKIDKTSKEIELPLKNEKSGSITIIKQDKDSFEKLQGAEFKIYNENVGWLTQNGEKIEYNKDYSKATAFVTNENGKIEINKIDLGNYYIYETKAPTNYYLGVQEGYRKADKGSESITEKDWVYVGSYKIDETHKEIEVPLKNDKHIGSLSITKQDSDTKEKLVGTEFKLYATNLNTNIIAGGKGWVTLNNGQIGYSTDYNTANAFTTNNEGTVLVENLSYGTYYIYETKAPTGYNIKEQDSYHVQQEGSTTIPQDQDWVALGNGQISNQNKEVKVTLNNQKYTKINGFVWLDNPDRKNNAYNNIYDEQDWKLPGQTNSENSNVTKDKLISGITVNLYSNKNELISTTKTGENGEYEFVRKTNGEKLKYIELQNSYVEFMYDNTKYVVADSFVGNNAKINSKAIEEVMTKEELEDEKLTGTEGNVPGRAVTYKGGNNSSANTLTAYYNSETYAIEDINLGLKDKHNPTFDVSENLEYVKVQINGYTYKYQHGASAGEARQYVPSVAIQKAGNVFSQVLYPSDIAYRAEDANKELSVYVVYSISVTNNDTSTIDDIYNEQKLYLNSLVNNYDNERYELCTDENTKDSADFRLWSDITDTQGNKYATYDLNKENSKYINGVSKGETITSYIQFKINKEHLRNMLERKPEAEEYLENAPTVAKASGYHEYLRTDNVWNEENSVKVFDGKKGNYNEKNTANEAYFVHKSLPVEDSSSNVFIAIKLGDNRTISGVVFEDKDENTADAERLGNGKFDNGETKIKDVVVSLLNETGNVTKVYPTTNHKTVEQNAITINKEDGTYEIVGMVPGKYYLQFTYGNGKTKYTDLDGKEISIATSKVDNNTVINPKLYKSTILTGNALNANDENWFKNDIGKNNSVATDLDEIINSRIGSDPNSNNLNTELNYKYVENSDSNGIINARSPKIDIKIEKTDKEEEEEEGPAKDSGIPAVCSGLSFGIIERPHVNIELEKKIKNVKLTLQNGTTIINGDPKDKNVSPNLASIDDSNAKLELDSSYIYGSNAVVTYTILAENKSELDYATIEYYKKGHKKEDDKPVTTTVTKIADYINNQNASYENQSDNVKVLNDTEKDNYFSAEVSNKNKNYKQTVFITDKALLPEAATPDDLSRSRTDEYEFTVNNLLSTSDGALGWESYAEIIGITNITLTPQSVSKSGNYVVGDNSTKEADTAEATISIYSSTGENRNLVIYYVIGGALLIIAVGIVLIKKFAIKTK